MIQGGESDQDRGQRSDGKQTEQKQEACWHQGDNKMLLKFTAMLTGPLAVDLIWWKMTL